MRIRTVLQMLAGFLVGFYVLPVIVKWLFAA
jgi:hypothetical protein